MKNTNDIKYVDVSKAFELNEDMEVENIIVGDSQIPLVSIKNVYKYPEKVREILINTPVSYTSSVEANGFAGRRGCIHNFIDSPNFYRLLNEKLSRHLRTYTVSTPGKLLTGNGEFLFNVFDSDENTANENAFTIPHADPGLIACILYLNTPEEEPNPVGTAVYQMKKTKTSIVPTNEKQFAWYMNFSEKSVDEINLETATYREIASNRPNDGKYVLEENEDFEILYKSSGEYNSLVAYVGCTLHSPLINYELFKNKDYKRINQVIFLHDYSGDDF